MKWKDLKQQWYWKYATNKYILITIVFVIWMLFLDGNAWLTSHRAMDKKIQEKEQTADFYMRGIARDQERIKQLKDSNGIEKFARERYLMKRDNEEIYIIEYADSIKNEDDER
ncbi:FtsB family cell division protein [Nonlabens ponticola]|uniref:Septum formation initiator family protein n=1 Tax=Nonlabens ponticola TaxID=2496866 RepID=A0A3S9MZF7_9FLAO|nr:septum formation initiator family protein [Nonlabens ponticola]AZQ44472.1 septum formation initiator family protein [Nonlabens ponticola]